MLLELWHILGCNIWHIWLLTADTSSLNAKQNIDVCTYRSYKIKIIYWRKLLVLKWYTKKKGNLLDPKWYTRWSVKIKGFMEKWSSMHFLVILQWYKFVNKIDAFSIAHIRFIKTSSTINEKNCIVFLSFTGNLNDLNLSLFQGFKVYH